jgi:hypothetical protein
MHYRLFLKCLSSNLSHVAHKGCYIVVKVKVKVTHSMLNSLLMLVLIWLKCTNIKRLKNISKMPREGIYMNTMRCCLDCKLKIHMAAMLVYKKHL